MWSVYIDLLIFTTNGSSLPGKNPVCIWLSASRAEGCEDDGTENYLRPKTNFLVITILQSSQSRSWLPGAPPSGQVVTVSTINCNYHHHHPWYCQVCHHSSLSLSLSLYGFCQRSCVHSILLISSSSRHRRRLVFALLWLLFCSPMCIYGEQTLATTCHNLLSPSQSFIALVPESSGLNGRTLNCRITFINLMTDWKLEPFNWNWRNKKRPWTNHLFVFKCQFAPEKFSSVKYDTVQCSLYFLQNLWHSTNF